ncbi:MAG: hypothetical protein NVS1B14_07380 [Vulcanimicrobiaceae bacterium]
MYDRMDNRGVPVSRGVPNLVQVSALIGLLLIFAIGAFTILVASYGHMWPASHSLRMPL